MGVSLTVVWQTCKQGLVYQLSLGNSVGCNINAPHHPVLDSHLKALVPGKEKHTDVLIAGLYIIRT